MPEEILCTPLLKDYEITQFFSILMMIVLGSSFFVACGDINGGVSGNYGDNGSGTNDNGTNVTITETSISIWITSYPNKVEYQVNEPFDSTGLAIESTITERYPDGTEKTFTEEIVCPNENITFSGTDFSTAGTKTITVTYTENETSKSVTFEITVKSAALSSIINYTTFDSEFKTLYDAVGENVCVSISYVDAANTTIEGGRFDGLVMDLLWYPEITSKFNSFFNAIAPENATAESLPKISARINAAGILIKNTANDYSYATNQQWGKAANENKWKGYNSDASLKYPDTSLISKAKLDEKKIHC